MPALARLEAWYLEQCDGVWEHHHRTRIDTLDNPGWSVEFDLEGTAMAGQPFRDFERKLDEHDWML